MLNFSNRITDVQPDGAECFFTDVVYMAAAA